MLHSVLWIRFQSIRRTTAALLRAEPFSTVMVFAVVAAGFWRLSILVADAEGRWAVAVSVIAFLLIVHTGRRDERFLRLAGVPHRRLFCAEYLLLALPFTILLAFSSGPAVAGVGIAGAMLLPWLPAGLLPRFLNQQAQRRTPFALPLPATCFE